MDKSIILLLYKSPVWPDLEFWSILRKDVYEIKNNVKGNKVNKGLGDLNYVEQLQ